MVTSPPNDSTIPITSLDSGQRLLLPIESVVDL